MIHPTVFSVSPHIPRPPPPHPLPVVYLPPFNAHRPPKCCLWCLQKIVQYVSRMAFILVIMENKHFCAAGLDALKLIVANKARFAFTGVFATFTLLIGKLVLMGVSGIGIYAWITNNKAFDAACDPNLDAYASVVCTPVTQPLVPLILVLIMAFFVSSAFMYIVEVRGVGRQSSISISRSVFPNIVLHCIAAGSR